MRVAITGAAGRLGGHLCSRLAESKEWDLVRIDLLDLPEGPGEARKADLSDLQDTYGALLGADVVIHCASIHPSEAYTDEQYLDVNVKGTWNVYAAAKKLGIKRAVLTSSIGVVGHSFPPEVWPVTEETETTPYDLYSLTKHCQELVARHYAEYGGISTVVLRPASFMPKGELETGRRLLGTFSLIEDVVEAHVAALRAENLPSRFEPFLITNRLPYGPEDADVAGDPWGLAERYYPGVRQWFSQRRVLPPDISVVYSLGKAERFLDWKPQYSFDWWWEKNRNRL